MIDVRTSCEGHPPRGGARWDLAILAPLLAGCMPSSPPPAPIPLEDEAAADAYMRRAECEADRIRYRSRPEILPKLDEACRHVEEALGGPSVQPVQPCPASTLAMP